MQRPDPQDQGWCPRVARQLAAAPGTLAVQNSKEDCPLQREDSPLPADESDNQASPTTGDEVTGDRSNPPRSPGTGPGMARTPDCDLGLPSGPPAAQSPRIGSGLQVDSTRPTPMPEGGGVAPGKDTESPGPAHSESLSRPPGFSEALYATLPMDRTNTSEDEQPAPPGFDGPTTGTSHGTTPVHTAEAARSDDRSPSSAPVLDSPAMLKANSAGAQVTGSGTASSASSKLRRFTACIFRKAASPLLPAPAEEAPKVHLHTRSRRIAAQPLSKVPASKRGEILIMKCLGLHQDPPHQTTAAKEVYNSIFIDQLSSSHAEAMHELFPEKDR